jgi:hypothetical protein
LKEKKLYIAAAGLAFLIALGFGLRTRMQYSSFQRTVTKALETSEGYDKRLIDMVNRLEEELARRASFGYEGGKDPMTGKKRRVLLPQKVKTSKGKVVERRRVADPVKLTAIIFDDKTKRYTAIVMFGERSYSVEVGDKVGKRKIKRITAEVVYMEGDSLYYKYDIYGKRLTVRKKAK